MKRRKKIFNRENTHHRSDVFLNKNELPVSAQFWSQVESSFLQIPPSCFWNPVTHVDWQSDTCLLSLHCTTIIPWTATPRVLSSVLTASWDSSSAKRSTTVSSVSVSQKHSKWAYKKHQAADGGGGSGLLSFFELSRKPLLYDLNINTTIKLFLLSFSLIRQACPQISAFADLIYCGFY